MWAFVFLFSKVNLICLGYFIPQNGSIQSKIIQFSDDLTNVSAKNKTFVAIFWCHYCCTGSKIQLKHLCLASRWTPHERWAPDVPWCPVLFFCPIYQVCCTVYNSNLSLTILLLGWSNVTSFCLLLKTTSLVITKSFKSSCAAKQAVKQMKFSQYTA